MAATVEQDPSDHLSKAGLLVGQPPKARRDIRARAHPRACRLRVCAKLPDTLDRGTYSGRTILITGGTGGVGLDAARAVRARGAQVVIGSRDPGRYAQAASGLGDEGIHPFIADVTDESQVERQLEILSHEGLELTDIIHAAAGGMEPVLRDLARLMAGIKRANGAERDRANSVARIELEPLVAGTRAGAMAVNFSGPVAFLTSVVPRLPKGGTVTFYSSLWASLYPHPQIPIYYEPVAEAKQALEVWLGEQAGAWAHAGITTAVVSANLILNTRMGQLLDRFCAELMAPEERERFRQTYVSSADLVASTLAVIDRAAGGSPPGFIRVFILGPGQVEDRVARDSPSMLFRLPLSGDPPTWADSASVSLE